jgi:hypothetical protein
MEEHYLLPLTIALLALATLAIGFRARTRRGYAPAIIAGISAAALVLLKFLLDSTPAAYAATGCFMAAALWNAWPVRRSTTCPACVSAAASPTK